MYRQYEILRRGHHPYFLDNSGADCDQVAGGGQNDGDGGYASSPRTLVAKAVTILVVVTAVDCGLKLIISIVMALLLYVFLIFFLHAVTDML